ncbi:MAG: zinc-dependent peptidase [Burkholderiales bacterium]|nr:zinc-dependent peptidase [Burkholderiales bacterium]
MIKEWRRRRLLRRVRLDPALWAQVTAALPFLGYLNEAELARLRDMAVIFLHEKEMHGVHGVELADDVRLSIALQACLPALNLGLALYDGWIGIVVYPGEFRVHREETDEDGVVHQWEDELAGESWPGGPVVLSWQDVRLGDAGYNVVIHEFAHKIDMLNGDADGYPFAHAGMDAAAWHRALEEGYARFCEAVDRGERRQGRRADASAAIDERGRELPFDPYAAEHPAEFFAVMSEEFFTDPLTLRDEVPALYRQLALFYRQDPAARLAAA